MTKDEALKLARTALGVQLDALLGKAGHLRNDDRRRYAENGIKAIDEALAQPEPWEKFCDSNCVWTDHHPDCKLAQPEQEPVSLRRGDILRCIETDELCTVWSTSTTGKTLIKWSANNFGAYTAEQIGELFWLEPEPDDLELAAEKSDNYAAFHAGYRFAVARGNTGDNT